MRNFTVDYNDMLEGDALACRPGNVAPGLEYLCEYFHPLLGMLACVTGLSYVSFISKNRRHNKLVARQRGDTTTFRSARERGEVQRRGILAQSDKVALALGTACVSYGLAFIVNGWGTMYPTQHIRGKIGDFVGEYKAFAVVIIT
jgi:hypothetical protein